MLDVRRLRLLHELAQRGTLAEVAATLHQSPSSVSQQLAQLERDVGTPLLRKVGRGVELTPAATVLVEHAAALLQGLEDAEAAVAALADQAAGTVRLAAFQSAAVAFMPQLLTHLAEHHPRVRVTMSQRVPEEALEAIRARELDLVIAVEYPGSAAPRYPELRWAGLATDTLQLAVPRTGRWRDASSLADVADAPWVMEPRPAYSRAWAELACRTAGFEPEVRYEVDDLETHAALVASGHAVAILPSLMTARRSPDARLVALAGAPRRTVHTVTRRAVADTPAIAACHAALRAIVPREL
ncbi:MAG: LysR family transcriptional regulator [Nocardioides sp.]|uniref:LysR family transcriptional regulator n=1 Tax=Nocardioides sp. TaxID=35761 RepID=UPI0039E30DE2